MPINSDLPHDPQGDLDAEAGHVGLSVGTNGHPEITTGADLVVYWEREGIVGSRPEIIDPSAHARCLRAEAERRRA